MGKEAGPTCTNGLQSKLILEALVPLVSARVELHHGMMPDTPMANHTPNPNLVQLCIAAPSSPIPTSTGEAAKGGGVEKRPGSRCRSLKRRKHYWKMAVTEFFPVCRVP